METCKYCGKETKKSTAHYAQCNKFKEWRKNTLTKEFLQKEYIDEEKSAIEIAHSIGLKSASGVLKALSRFGFDVRNIKQSKNKREKEKRKLTNIERYGVEHNFSKNHPSRKEWEKRLFDEEGITNVFQRQSVKRSIIATNIEKYGASHHMKSKEFLKTFFDNFEYEHGYRYPIKSPNNKFKGTISGPQKRVINELTKCGYEFFTEFSIYPFRVDFLIKGTKKIIEVNGDYWHANPKKYKADDLLSFPGFNRKVPAKEIWNKNKKRLSYLKSNGFEVFEIWEHEINKTFEESFKNLINYIEDGK